MSGTHPTKNPMIGRLKLFAGVVLILALPIYFSGALEEPQGIRRAMVQSLTTELVSQVHHMRTTAQDAHGFNLCRFGDFCLSKDNLVLFTRGEESATAMNTRMHSCCSAWSQLQPASCDQRFPELFCRCFTSRIPPIYRAMPESPPKFEPGGSFMINQWATTGDPDFHHPRHFAMKFFVFLSVMQHAKEYSISQIKSMIWQDGFPLNDYETTIFNVAQKMLPHPIQNLFFQPDTIGEAGDKETCFESAYSSVPYQFWGGSKAAYDQFRATSLATYGFPAKSLFEGCPPSRAAIFRDIGPGTHVMVNDDGMARLVKRAGYPTVDFINSKPLPGTNETALDQARQLSQYGLVISSHGSQLHNILYLPKNAAVVQVAPLIIDHVWSDLAAVLSLRHYFSSAHPSSPPSDKTLNLIDKCTVYNIAGRKCEVISDSEKGHSQFVDLEVDLLAFELTLRSVTEQRIADCDGLL